MLGTMIKSVVIAAVAAATLAASTIPASGSGYWDPDDPTGTTWVSTDPTTAPPAPTVNEDAPPAPAVKHPPGWKSPEQIAAELKEQDDRDRAQNAANGITEAPPTP
jgi:hypothetical protein